MPKSEFIRGKPKSTNNAAVVYGIAHKVIPILLIVFGLTIASIKLSLDLPAVVEDDLPLFTYAGVDYYAPWMFFVWMARIYSFNSIYNDYYALFEPSANVAAIFTGVAVVIYFIMSLSRGLVHRFDSLYGSARWATKDDLAKNGFLSDSGLICGQLFDARITPSFYKDAAGNSVPTLKTARISDLICHGVNFHTLLVAPTRTGKGVGVIIPTCLSYFSSIFVYDPKAEVYRYTAGFRSRFSHVIRFAPTSMDVGVSINILQEIRCDEHMQSDATKMARVLIEGAGEASGGSTEAHFNETAIKALEAAIMHVILSDHIKEKSIGSLVDFLTMKYPDSDDDEEPDTHPFLTHMINYDYHIPQFYLDNYIEPLREKIAKSSGSDKRHYEIVLAKKLEAIEIVFANIKNRANEAHNKPKNELGSLFSTVTRGLGIFTDPIVRSNTTEHDFSIDSFFSSENPISFYFTVPFSDTKDISPVVRLYVTYLVQRISGGETSFDNIRMKNKLLFILDEFPVLGKFDFLKTSMGILAGFGVYFLIIIQSLTQLAELYGEKNPFLEHCSSWISYAPNDIGTAETFSKIIGKETVWKEQVSSSGSKYEFGMSNMNLSGSEVERNLINADEIMRMGRDKVLIFSQGNPAYIGKKILYYDDPRFKSLVSLPCPQYREDFIPELPFDKPPLVYVANPNNIIDNTPPPRPSDDISTYAEQDRSLFPHNTHPRSVQLAHSGVVPDGAPLEPSIEDNPSLASSYTAVSDDSSDDNGSSYISIDKGDSLIPVDASATPVPNEQLDTSDSLPDSSSPPSSSSSSPTSRPIVIAPVNKHHIRPSSLMDKDYADITILSNPDANDPLIPIYIPAPSSPIIDNVAPGDMTDEQFYKHIQRSRRFAKSHEGGAGL